MARSARLSHDAGAPLWRSGEAVMNAQPTRLLLVEDNAGDARLLQEALKEVADPPFEITHLYLLQDALACLAKERFAAILLDLSLPDGQGLGMVKQVVACAPQMAILVLTGLVDEQVALNALSEGAQDYIIKGSLDSVAIARAIRYAIQRKQFLERIRLLREIDQAIGSTLDLKEIFAAFLERIESLFAVSASFVHRLDGRDALQPFVGRHLRAEELKPFPGDAKAILAHLKKPGTAPFTLKTLDADVDPETAAVLRHHGWSAVLQVPLTHNSHLWGLVSLFMEGKPQLSEDESDILKSIFYRLTVAVQNAQLYESIVNLAEDLRRSNKVKDEFLSIMSHELRTPLNVMMNCAEILRTGVMGEVSADQASILDRLLVQAKNQLGLVNGILHVTRMETDKVEISCEEMVLSEFLQDMKGDYDISFSNKEVALRWDIPDDLPRIQTDRDKIRHILENLINNAIKFTSSGEIRVSARRVMVEKTVNVNHQWFELEVSDTGAGIPEDSLNTIFEKFQQLDTTSTRIHGGVGIGLYLVKRFTDLLHGTISVSSEVGKGSSFRITIPCTTDTPSSGEHHLAAAV